MKHRILAAALTFLTSLAFASPETASAQFWEDIKETAENAAKGEVLGQVDQLARDAVRCAFDDLDCIQGAQQQGEQVVLTNESGEILMDEEGNPVTDPSQLPPGMQKPAAAAPGAGTVNANYDFKAGERPLFASDLAAANVGDFPPELEWIKGNMAVVEWQGQRLLLATSASSFAIPLGETLPEQFTVEFVLHDPATEGGTDVSTTEEYGEVPYFNFGYWRGSGLWGGEGEMATGSSAPLAEGLVPVRIMADGAHVKAYLGQTRVVNVPRAELPREDRLYFTISASQDRPIYLGDFRVAAGGRDLYEALEAEGRVAVRDILFDTGKATIKPESEKVLSEIGTMLQEHPDLSLLIEGHTDDQGGFDMNMTLSRDRAASVKAYLVETYSIADSRLRTMGLGPTQPVADNATEEGRAQNRRVELVRIEGSGSGEGSGNAGSEDDPPERAPAPESSPAGESAREVPAGEAASVITTVPDVCSLLTRSDVEEIFGGQFGEGRTADAGLRHCSYRADSGDRVSLAMFIAEAVSLQDGLQYARGDFACPVEMLRRIPDLGLDAALFKDAPDPEKRWCKAGDVRLWVVAEASFRGATGNPPRETTGHFHFLFRSRGELGTPAEYQRAAERVLGRLSG